MAHIRRDEEGVCIGAGDEAAGAAVCELIDDAFDDRGEEVSAGTLPEKGADFFIVEEGDHFDYRGLGGGSVEEGLDGGPGAELVVDAAGEDEFVVEAAGCSRLDVEKFKLPVYNG